MKERGDEFSQGKMALEDLRRRHPDALKLQPGRKFTLVHRYHQTRNDEIFREFKDYPGSVRPELQVFHRPHVLDPQSPLIKDLLPELPDRDGAPGSSGATTMCTASAGAILEYAREYIRNIPGPDKIAGFFMGPDGYIWGREFLSTDPETPRQPVISKQWYSFLLWGRLSYDPELTDAYFQQIVSHRLSPSDPRICCRGRGQMRPWSFR